MDHYDRSGLVFSVRDGGDRGRAGPPVILLHGFPETAAAWDGVVPALHAAGWRTLAPDQRGYSPGARPRAVSAYRLAELTADVLALADAAGAARFHLVGHDWGGIVAWHLAATQPARVASLAVLSTPHPRAYARALATSAQGLRSWYVAAVQLRGLPERALLAADARLLRRALLRSGLESAWVERYVVALQAPGALTAALNWYRALPLSTSAVGAIGPIRVPTLYLWSTLDVALGRAAAERTGDHVDAPYRFEVLEGVPHWIPEAVPGRVAHALLEHLSA